MLIRIPNKMRAIPKITAQNRQGFNKLALWFVLLGVFMAAYRYLIVIMIIKIAYI